SAALLLGGAAGFAGLGDVDVTRLDIHIAGKSEHVAAGLPVALSGADGHVATQAAHGAGGGGGFASGAVARVLVVVQQGDAQVVFAGQGQQADALALAVAVLLTGRAVHAGLDVHIAASVDAQQIVGHDS